MARSSEPNAVLHHLQGSSTPVSGGSNNAGRADDGATFAGAIWNQATTWPPGFDPPLEAMSARGTGDPHTPRSGIVNDETPRWPPWKIIYFGFMCMLGAAAIWLFVLLMLYAFAG